MESSRSFKPVLSLVTGLLLLMVEELSAGNHRNHEDARCPAPQYPANVKVLMDSWYQPLLPAEDGSTSANWTTNTGSNHGTCGESSVSLCSGESGVQQLNTRLILKTFSAYPVRIFVNVTYSFVQCPWQTCSGDLELEMITHTSTKTATPGPDPITRDVIMQVNRIQNTSDVSNGTKQLHFDFKTPVATRFSLAIRGVRTCVTVSQVLVYQYQCPRLSTICGHATQQAPVSGAVVVRSNCAESYHFSSVAVSDFLMCTSEGRWLTCEYFEDNEEVTCKESKSVPEVSQPSATPVPSQPLPRAPHSSSPTPLLARGALSGGTTVEDRDCQSPTALLAIVAVLIAIILAIILTVVALVISMMRTHMKFRPDKSEGVLTEPVYPVAHSKAPFISSAGITDLEQDNVNS